MRRNSDPAPDVAQLAPYRQQLRQIFADASEKEFGRIWRDWGRLECERRYIVAALADGLTRQGASHAESR